MSFDIQNYPLENFWQFAHYHPLGAVFIGIGVFIILISICFILFNLVTVLKTVSNRINTFTVGKISFSLTDKSLKSTDLESMIQHVVSTNDEYRCTFETEAWKLLESKFLKDPYKSWQYAAVAVTIVNHNFAVEMKSSKGNIFIVVMCDDKGDYYFSLYTQEGIGSLDESKRLSNRFTTAAEIDMFLSRH